MHARRSNQIRPLDDITVLDFTVALAGPFGTLLLAGLGARVIKIENPLAGDTCRDNAPYLGERGATLTRQHPDDVSVSELNRLRNKQAITLNLKDPASREVFADLVKHADVIFENFAPGVMDRLGAGYERARETNPRIVYCSLTGYGSHAQNDAGSGKALDAMIQALSGVMMTSGVEGDPPVRVGVPFADLCTPLFGVIGVLSALHQARRTGVGQHVDVSMLGVMSMMVAGEPFDLMERCGVPQRTGLTVPRLSPFGIYRTSNGYISICAYTERFAQLLFRAIGRPELGSDPKFATRDQRVVHVRELDGVIEQYTSKMTSAEAVAAIEGAGVPAAEIRTPGEAVRDPRTLARADTVKLTHPKYGDVEDAYGMGMPIKFSEASAGFDQPAPRMGEHNDAIYGGLLGYSQDRIEDLRRRGVI